MPSPRSVLTPAHLAARGVHEEPYLVGTSLVLVSVARSGQVLSRRVVHTPAEYDEAVRAMRDELDEFDPAPPLTIAS